MPKCYNCGEKFDYMSYECKFCNHSFCNKCRLPEIHNCKVFKKENKIKQEKWQKDAKEILLKIKEEGKISVPEKIILSPIKNKKKVIKKIKEEEKSYNLEVDDESIEVNNLNSKIKPIKKRKFLFFIIPVLLIIFVLFIFLNENTEEVNKIKVDTLSQNSFNFINNYRIEKNSVPINFSYELYPLLMNISDNKFLDSTSFSSASEINSYLSKNINLNKFSSYYSKIYFIGGGGYESFIKKFNEDYVSRNFFGNGKYNFGAIACNLDYCTVFIFENKPEDT